MFYLLLFVFGCGVGAMSGLLGIGGGIALVPGLVYLFGLSQQQAQGTSLGVLIPPIGIFAAWVYYQNGYIRLPIVGWVAGGFVIGAFLGAKLVPYVRPEYLRVAFGLLLLYTGFLFVSTPLRFRTGAALPAGLATLAAAALGLVMRRMHAGRPKPASDEIEYHI